jgi:aquaporin Z
MGESSALARYLCEFIGTYLLVFTVGCNVLSPAGPWAATSIACVLMVSIYAMAATSGANFNPAVSLTLGVSGKLPLFDMGIYIVVQLIAGILAGLSYYALFGTVFNLQPGKGFGWWEAMIVEVAYTFMLCFVVLNVATARKNEGNQYFGLAIGFVIIAGGYAAGPVSGGCFNPAVAFGIDVASSGIGFGWAFAYLGYEMIGAGLASLAFRIVRPDEFFGDPVYGPGQKLFAEFLGTFFLVFTVGLNVLNGGVAAVWSIAASLMCMIYALGSVSGAHFNPAVTFAIVCAGRRKISIADAAMYVVVQFVGGIVAAFSYAAVYHGKTFHLHPNKQDGYDWGDVAAGEVVFTFVLCYVVLCVATTTPPGPKEPHSRDMFGLAIGSCVTVGGFAVGPCGSGALNPAVAVGVASASIMTGGIFINALAYVAFELIGAALAAAAFHVTHASEYKTLAYEPQYRPPRSERVMM